MRRSAKSEKRRGRRLKRGKRGRDGLPVSGIPSRLHKQTLDGEFCCACSSDLHNLPASGGSLIFISSFILISAGLFVCLLGSARSWIRLRARLETARLTCDARALAGSLLLGSVGKVRDRGETEHRSLQSRSRRRRTNLLPYFHECFRMDISAFFLVGRECVRVVVCLFDFGPSSGRMLGSLSVARCASLFLFYPTWLEGFAYRELWHARLYTRFRINLEKAAGVCECTQF